MHFLASRIQNACVNGSKCSIAAVSNSIIQGSILGLALFVLFVNDITSVSHACRVKLC